MFSYYLLSRCRRIQIFINQETRPVIAALLILFGYSYANAQDPLAEIRNRFDSFRQNNLQEKIFLHTDKNNYVPGEICWFKIYNVDASFHHPIRLGKVAYIEVLDKNNKTVLDAKVALNKDGGEGSLYLPTTLVSGNYRLRAYTNWMKNDGADYFFEKTLSIINVQKIQQENSIAGKNTYDIGLFPEGGNLVNGIKSKVGIRIVNQFGKGVDFEGVLLNEKDDTIATFHPLRFGIGNFSFIPLEGSRYRASVNITGGGRQVKELQPAFNTGYTMKVEHTGGRQIKIVVQTPEAGNLSSSPVFLFAHRRNVLNVAMSNTIRNGKAEFIVDDTTGGDGITHFTIFDKNRQPLCERLFYKSPKRTLQISAATSKPVYSLREKITIDINSATEEGSRTPANMSMAVFRVDSLNVNDEQDINNYLLLTADLSGPVESPGYYFSQDTPMVSAALDNLMLTQGWRRFNWENVLSGNKPAFQFLPEINGHIINGKITALQPGAPVQYINTYLSVPGIRTQFKTAQANKEGLIKFEMKDFYSEGDIIVQTNNEKDSLYRIDVASPFFGEYSGNVLAPFNLAKQKNALLEQYIASQVQNTFFYDKLNQSSLTQWDTAAFYSKADVTYLLDNYVRFTTLEEVLREYVLEVNVRQRNGKFYLPVYDESTKTSFTTSPLVILDGVPVFDFNALLKYDPLKIRKMEIVNRTYYLGNNSFDGIINFYTYTGKMEGYDIDPRATIIDYEGLQLQRAFYSPEYETDQQLRSRMPDFRSLLQWSPTIKTNGNDNVQTTFFSSDAPGRYAIVVQGISDDGRAGTSVSYFEVKKR